MYMKERDLFPPHSGNKDAGMSLFEHMLPGGERAPSCFILKGLTGSCLLELDAASLSDMTDVMDKRGIVFLNEL